MIGNDIAGFIYQVICFLNFQMSAFRIALIFLSQIYGVLGVFIGIYGWEKLHMLESYDFVGIFAVIFISFFATYIIIRSNINSLEALFKHIEDQEGLKQIFDNLDQSIIVFEEERLELINDQFLELFSEHIEKSKMTDEEISQYQAQNQRSSTSV